MPPCLRAFVPYPFPVFGSHLSVAGGMANALREAERLRMDSVQVFTRNQRQWSPPPLDSANADEWRAELARLGWQDRTVSHNSYLVNLAGPDATLRRQSLAAMRDEVERCESLGIPFLVFHPGAHLGDKKSPEDFARSLDAGIARLAESVAEILRSTRGYRTVLCLENTAGSGTTLGRTFEELGLMRTRILDSSGGESAARVGFCIDTCHALAAGYDIAARETSGPAGRRRTLAEGEARGLAMLDELDRVCGLSNVRAFHLNDSKGALGSRLDRHAHIGKGHVALGAFGAIVNHPALRLVPKILETPKEDDARGRPMDLANLRRLKSLLRVESDAAGLARSPSSPEPGEKRSPRSGRVPSRPARRRAIA